MVLFLIIRPEQEKAIKKPLRLSGSKNRTGAVQHENR